MFRGRADSQVKLNGYRIELAEIEAVISAVPGVHECVAAVQKVWGTERLCVHAVPRRITELEDAFLAGRRGVASRSSASQASTWDETCRRIRLLHPRRILEIGASCGELMKRIAPCCESYFVLDHSRQVVDRLTELCQSSVELQHVIVRNADAGSWNLNEKFDLVILNSVAERFPTRRYLESCIRRALDVLNFGGAVFVGDIRNFTESGQRNNSRAAVEMGHTIPDNEMWISPEFFSVLLEAQQEISAISVLFRKDLDRQEFDRNRFDAILLKGNRTSVQDEMPDIRRDILRGTEVNVPGSELIPDESGRGYHLWSGPSEAWPPIWRLPCRMKGEERELTTSPALANAESTLLPLIRATAQEKLPPHMVPSVIVLCESVPKNPSGKIARSALPLPSIRARGGLSGASQPESSLEKCIVSCWGKNLGIAGLGVDDDFFDYGGNSIIAIRCISQLRGVLHANVPVDMIHRSKTAREFARRMLEIMPCETVSTSEPLEQCIAPADGRSV
jgi:cyclopropane fatty-acyl-phospholipid synthase-like methyltransferase